MFGWFVWFWLDISRGRGDYRGVGVRGSVKGEGEGGKKGGKGGIYLFFIFF